MPPTPTIFFLGATGGVINACLTATLTSNSYKAIAMVRTPSKLQTQLLTLQGLTESTLSNLTIVQGDATNPSDIQAALLTHVTSGLDSTLPIMIITGVGGAPKLRFNLWRPLQFAGLDNPRICETAATSVLTALREIYGAYPGLAKSKPDLTFISTTGISRGAEDVPWSMRFLYHQVLTEPHVDKRGMEDMFRGDATGEQLLGSVTGIRPTLLMGSGKVGEGVGIEKIRVGVEGRPALGYTVARGDVGEWVFERVIKGGQADGGRWRGEMVSLTS